MPGTEYYLELLKALGVRAREEPKNLADAAPVVSDLSRLLMRGSASDVRSVMAGATALRNELVEDQTRCHAADRLRSAEAQPFLAGALWALEEVAQARLASFETAPKPMSVTRRELVRQLVLEELGVEPVSPSELLESDQLRQAGLRADEVSRAIGTLVDGGQLEVVPPPAGGDRRRKFYRRATN